MNRTSFKYFTAAGITAVAIIFSLAFSKPRKAAKLPEVKADTFYYLQGRRPDFEALAFAIDRPDDITPNQRKQLLQWLGSVRMISVLPDSLNKKKK